jgi:hypothetical protein
LCDFTYTLTFYQNMTKARLFKTMENTLYPVNNSSNWLAQQIFFNRLNSNNVFSQFGIFCLTRIDDYTFTSYRWEYLVFPDTTTGAWEKIHSKLHNLCSLANTRTNQLWMVTNWEGHKRKWSHTIFFKYLHHMTVQLGTPPNTVVQCQRHVWQDVWSLVLSIKNIHWVIYISSNLLCKIWTYKIQLQKEQ